MSEAYTKANGDLERLTECEGIVMKCIWDADSDVSLMNIMASITQISNKEWKRQTVSTFLLHLITKGYASSYRVGRVFYYHPEVSLEAYQRKITQDFKNFWYNGDTEKLVEMLQKLDEA